MSKATVAPTGPAAGKLIDELLVRLSDWRADTLAEVRRLIHEALPDVVETWKWMGSPVWEKDGILLVGNAHQQKVKLTFPRGAQLSDPSHVFNNGLGGKTWRAIDLHEGDALDAAPFQALIRAAASHNAVSRTTVGHTPGARTVKRAEGSGDAPRKKGERA